jgi:hypothetical protein
MHVQIDENKFVLFRKRKSIIKFCMFSEVHTKIILDSNISKINKIKSYYYEKNYKIMFKF